MSISIYLTKYEEIMKPEYLSVYSDGLRTEQQGSIPGRGKKFCSTQQRLDGLWSLPSLLSKDHNGSFPGGKAVGA
jgi:hypothetical protein